LLFVIGVEDDDSYLETVKSKIQQTLRKQVTACSMLSEKRQPEAEKGTIK